MALSKKITRSDEGMRVWQQERFIFEVTESICELLDNEGISRTELARRLNKTKGYISQLLDGQTNMTIRTVSDVFTSLNRAAHIFDGPLALSAPRNSFRFAPEAWADKKENEWHVNFEIKELTETK